MRVVLLVVIVIVIAAWKEGRGLEGGFMYLASGAYAWLVSGCAGKGGMDGGQLVVVVVDNVDDKR